MKKLITNLFFTLLILFIISGIFTLYSSPLEKAKEIPLNELIAQINDGRVAKITIEENNLTIELKDGAKEKSHKEQETSLTQSLINYGVNQEKLKEITLEVKQASGFMVWAVNLLPFIIPFILIALFLWFMFRQAQKGQTQALMFGKSNPRLTNPLDKRNKITFKDVAGVEEAKEELKEIVDFLKHPKKFIDIGARIPRGVLLMGPPGSGKTLLARAVAGEANVPFFHISGSEFVEMFVGVGASRVRDLFKIAKKNSPSIVFVDEIDAVGRHRGAGIGGGHDEREQTLNQILVEMDGFTPNDNCLIIAATNRGDLLDPALLRPGRFDRTVVLDMPDLEGRKAILAIHAQGKHFAKNVSWEKIAKRTVGFSGADLENMLNEAAILAARQNEKEIEEKDLEEAAVKVKLGPERKRLQSDEDKKMTAYHEAGHAVVNYFCLHTDPVHRISIVARGMSLGHTLIAPLKDRSQETKTRLLERIQVMMGGRAAEEMIFSEITTGAANDIAQATRVSRAMVVDFGMSTLGPVSLGPLSEVGDLGRVTWYDQTTISPEMQFKIDSEVKKIVDAAYKIAEEILEKNRKKLDKIAKELVEKETLEEEEFEKLMK